MPPKQQEKPLMKGAGKKKRGGTDESDRQYLHLYKNLINIYHQLEPRGVGLHDPHSWRNMDREGLAMHIDSARRLGHIIPDNIPEEDPPTVAALNRMLGAGKKKDKKPKKKAKVTKSQGVLILKEVNKILKRLAKKSKTVSRKPRELKQVKKDIDETLASRDTLMKELDIIPRKPDIRDVRASMPIFPRANILEGQPSLPTGVAEEIKELKKKAEEGPIRQKELKEQIMDKHKLFEDIMKNISVEIKNQQLKTADLEKLVKEAGLSDAEAIKMAQQIEEMTQPKPLMLEDEVKEDIASGAIPLADLEAAYNAQNLGSKFPTVADLRDEKAGWREYWERTKANYPSMTKEDFIRNWLVGKDVLGKVIDQIVGVPVGPIVEEVEEEMPPIPAEEEEAPKEKKKKKKKHLPSIDEDWLADKSSHGVRRYKALVASQGFPEAKGLVKWYEAKLARKEAQLATATGAAKKSLKEGIIRDKGLIVVNQALLD